MFFISVDDFYKFANEAKRISREEEKMYARKMLQGDAEARKNIVYGYYYFVASKVKRCPLEFQTLHVVYQCIDVLEKEVDKFDFMQDNYTFIHHLSKAIRQRMIRCLVKD